MGIASHGKTWMLQWLTLMMYTLRTLVLGLFWLLFHGKIYPPWVPSALITGIDHYRTTHSTIDSFSSNSMKEPIHHWLWQSSFINHWHRSSHMHNMKPFFTVQHGRYFRGSASFTAETHLLIPLRWQGHLWFLNLLDYPDPLTLPTAASVSLNIHISSLAISPWIWLQMRPQAMTGSGHEVLCQSNRLSGNLKGNSSYPTSMLWVYKGELPPPHVSTPPNPQALTAILTCLLTRF